MKGVLHISRVNQGFDDALLQKTNGTGNVNITAEPRFDLMQISEDSAEFTTDSNLIARTTTMEAECQGELSQGERPRA